MEDKEVGELWEWAAIISPVGWVDNQEVLKLIRKLVEQAAITRWWADNCKGDSLSPDNINFALERFGINPKDF